MDNYKFFQNRPCEAFPCHKDVDLDDFNCIFCYCPLYALGRNCGGNFRYNEKGIKDCTKCTIPHRRENYDLILERLRDVIEMVREEENGS